MKPSEPAKATEIKEAARHLNIELINASPGTVHKMEERSKTAASRSNVPGKALEKANQGFADP